MSAMWWLSKFYYISALLKLHILRLINGIVIHIWRNRFSDLTLEIFVIQMESIQINAGIKSGLLCSIVCPILPVLNFIFFQISLVKDEGGAACLIFKSQNLLMNKGSAWVSVQTVWLLQQLYPQRQLSTQSLDIVSIKTDCAIKLIMLIMFKTLNPIFVFSAFSHYLTIEFDANLFLSSR